MRSNIQESDTFIYLYIYKHILTFTFLQGMMRQSSGSSSIIPKTRTETKMQQNPTEETENDMIGQEINFINIPSSRSRPGSKVKKGSGSARGSVSERVPETGKKPHRTIDPEEIVSYMIVFVCLLSTIKQQNASLWAVYFESTELHSSVGSVADLRTWGRWFNPQLGQYCFLGLMVVIATGFIPFPLLSIVSTVVM